MHKASDFTFITIQKVFQCSSPILQVVKNETSVLVDFTVEAAERCPIIVALYYFANVTGKYLCQSFFYVKLQAGLQVYLNKTAARQFSFKFLQNCKSLFFTGYL